MQTKRVKRRRHSDELRAEVVQACRQPGASVAAIALRSGLNANVVYRWLKQDGGRSDAGAGRQTVVTTKPLNTFVPVAMAQAEPVASAPDIRIELRRGAASVTVSWPLQGAGECAAWLRDWLR